MECLETDVLLCILTHLSPRDLIAARLTCRRLCSISSHGSLWKTLCHRRWHAPASQHAQAGSWERVFTTCNGLLRTDVHAEVLQLPPNAGDTGGCIAGSGNAQGLIQVAAGRSNTVDIITMQSHLLNSGTPMPAPSPTAASVLQPVSYHSIKLPEARTASALSWAGAGHRLLVGTLQGMLYVYNCHHLWDGSLSQSSQHQHSSSTPTHVAQHSSLPVGDILQTGADTPPACSAQDSLEIATQAQWSALRSSSGFVAVLHDSYVACVDEGPLHQNLHQLQARNVIHMYSPDLEHHVGQVMDIMETWQFVCMAAVGPGSPAELAVGSVAGPSCSGCWNNSNPWMCWHKSRARSAVLCMVDSRSPGFITARYSLQHRSMYPRLCVLRQHYVVTSHANKPLCVWDLRAMSVPLYQQDWLEHTAQGPLGSCAQRPDQQGLWLTCTEDLLVGRADNGCVWAWDLSSVLGAADNSSTGWWEAAAQDHDSQSSHQGNHSWPRCLGSVPLGSAGVPATLLLPRSPAPTLVCLTSSQACLAPDRDDSDGPTAELAVASNGTDSDGSWCESDGSEGDNEDDDVRWHNHSSGGQLHAHHWHTQPAGNAWSPASWQATKSHAWPVANDWSDALLCACFAQL